MEIATSYIPFITIIGCVVFYLTNGLKQQVKGKPDSFSKRIEYWLPTLPLPIGGAMGLMFHPLLPVESLSLNGSLTGLAYGLTAAVFASKIYEQATRKIESAPAPVSTPASPAESKPESEPIETAPAALKDE